MQQLLPAPGSVHGGGFIKARVNPGEGGEENDRIPAKLFPDIRRNDNAREQVLIAQEKIGSTPNSPRNSFTKPWLGERI